MPGFKRMVNMARTTEEKISAIEESMPMPAAAADYPYGLRISLDERDLEKLGLSDEIDEVAEGSMIHLVAMGRVCSVSKNEFNGVRSCRVEICLEDIGVEDEDQEGAAVAKRYGNKR